MTISSTPDARPFVLTLTPGPPPTHDHVMYGDSVPALVDYLCAAAHVFPTIRRVSILPVQPDAEFMGTDLLTLPRLRVELVNGDLYVGGMNYGHGPHAHALFALLQHPPSLAALDTVGAVLGRMTP